MSHHCESRHTKFHICTLKEPWTKKAHTHILTLTGNKHTRSQCYSKPQLHIQTQRERHPLHLPHSSRHKHQYTNTYRNKSRPIQEPVPYPYTHSETQTRTGTHGISQTHTHSPYLNILKHTCMHRHECGDTWTHTHTTQTIPLLCPLIHSPTSASTSDRHDRALQTEECYDPSPTEQMSCLPRDRVLP